MSLMSTPERPRERARECVFCKASRAQRMLGAQAPLKCVREGSKPPKTPDTDFSQVGRVSPCPQEPRILTFQPAPEPHVEPGKRRRRVRRGHDSVFFARDRACTPIILLHEARMTKLMAQSRFDIPFARVRSPPRHRILIFLR